MFIYNEDVCPNPPSSINLYALLNASSKLEALYIANTGDSFSCANSSDSSTLSTSPTSIFIFSSTSTPASFAIVYADCPTILAFNAPFIIIVFLTFSVSSAFSK